MRIRILAYTVCIFVLILLQSTLLDYLKIFGVKPNLLLIFIVSVALLRGNVEGAAIGFFAGLAHDMLSGKILGFYAFLGLYLGLTIGSVNKRLYRENIFVILFFTFVSTFSYEAAVYLLGSLLPAFFGGTWLPVELMYSLRNVILPEAVYNSVASIIIYIFVIKLNHKFEDMNRASRKY